MANNKVSKGSKGSKGSTAVPPRKEKNMSVDQILDALRSQVWRYDNNFCKTLRSFMQGN